MTDKLKDFFNKIFKRDKKITEEEAENSRAAAKDRLHIVLMQDRANISADFLDLMREEIIEVIKKYIVVNEKEIDVRLTHSVQEDGTPNPPSLYANIPIVNIRNDMKARSEAEKKELEKEEKLEKKSKKETDKDKEKEKNLDKEKTNNLKIEQDEKINIIIDKAEEVKKEAKKEAKKEVKKEEKNEKEKQTEDKEKKK